MNAMASQITGRLDFCSTVCSGADQRKHQSSLAFVRGIHRWPVDSPHKGPVTRQIYPFDDFIMSHIFLGWPGSTYLDNTHFKIKYHYPSCTGPSISLRCRHDGRDSVSNHQPHHCLLNRLFRRRSKKTSKLRVTGLCAGNSPGTDEFPAQMASNAENFSIWWRHHDSENSNLGQ